MTTSNSREVEEWEKEFEEEFSYGGFGGLLPRHRDGGRILMQEVKGHIRTLIASRDTYWKEKLQKARDEALRNVPVGFVRQWINEELLKPGHRLVTDEDIQKFINVALDSK